ncbi:MAG: hypothetical protein LBG65_06200 [Puniceicoccales bacterium]|jgi:hypothetical protein|nr:hypothetical protein [Puniceicoccales bacterium]
MDSLFPNDIVRAQNPAIPVFSPPVFFFSSQGVATFFSLGNVCKKLACPGENDMNGGGINNSRTAIRQQQEQYT